MPKCRVPQPKIHTLYKTRHFPLFSYFSATLYFSLEHSRHIHLYHTTTYSTTQSFCYTFDTNKEKILTNSLLVSSTKCIENVDYSFCWFLLLWKSFFKHWRWWIRYHNGDCLEKWKLCDNSEVWWIMAQLRWEAASAEGEVHQRELTKGQRIGGRK